MFRCDVLTPWYYDADRNTNEMAVALDYPGVWSDVTGQPDSNLLPDPNLFVVRGEISEAQLDALLMDTDYVVLWYEEIT